MSHTRMPHTSRPRALFGLAFALLFLVGCGGQMADQPRCDPFDPSEFFDNGQCSRQLVPNTVARGQLQDDVLLYTGRGSDVLEEVPDSSETRESGDEATEQEQAGTTQQQADQTDATQGQQAPQYSTEFPFPVTMEVLERGQNRYNIYCTPCHSMDGSGDGMIVRRGFPPPSSFHISRLREAEPGYLYDVITNGIGAMPDYDGQIQEPADRWAIVAYIRALQLSQNATLDDVPADQQATLGDDTAQPEDEQPDE